MWWLNLIIVAFMIQSILIGWKLGGLVAISEAAGLVVATFIGVLSAPGLAKLFAHGPSSVRPYALLIGFLLVWVIIQNIWYQMTHLLIRRTPADFWNSGLNGAVGGLANMIRTIMVLIVTLLIVLSLPIPPKLKAAITDRPISSLLVRAGSRYQSAVTELVHDNIGKSLAFLTTHKSQDEKVIELGFVSGGNISPSQEQTMLLQVNKERTSRGLSVLTFDDHIRDVARAHSLDMLAQGYFAHTNKSGQDPFDRLTAGGVSYGAAGENLALAPTLTLAHEGLMNSPEHKDNILSREYHRIGIGIIDAGQYGLMVTQDFAD